MWFRSAALVLCALCGAAGAARAEVSLTSSSGPSLESLSFGNAQPGVGQGAGGVKLGESSLLHLGLTGQVGYDSNVFYSEPARSSAVLHVTPAFELTNAGRGGGKPGGAYYTLGASLNYREYLTGDDAVKQQRAFTPTVGGAVEFSSGQTLSLGLSDSFSRIEEPPYQADQASVTRDTNLASLTLRLAPGGGRIGVSLRYTNALDIYEDAPFSDNNNMGNELVLDAAWRWFPKTALYVQVAQGIISYLDSATTKHGSYPLHAMAGLRGLLTEKLVLHLAAGYTNAFYSGGVANLSGFGNVAIVTELTYSVSALARAGIGYRHDFRNSPQLGDYYNVDAVYVAFNQMVAGRVLSGVYARFENRGFHGTGLDAAVEGRVDQNLIGGATVDWFIHHYFFAGVGGNVSLNRGNRGATEGAIYTKYQLLARVGVAY